jgi:SAM-dependent methyltransferase
VYEKMTDKVCPICHSDKSDEYFQDPIYPDVHVHLCLNCGAAFLHPHLTEDETKKFNTESYNYGNAIYIPSAYAIYEKRINKQAEFIQKNALKKGRILDIGCYKGDLLALFHAEGWDCYAVESSMNACGCMESERPYIKCHQGFVEDRPFAGDSFDVIVSSRTLNHILDPVGFLSGLATYANSHTCLYMEVSSLESVKVQKGVECGGYFKPYHPIVYTMPVLVDVLNRSGWGGFLSLDTISDYEGATVYLRVMATRTDFANEAAIYRNKILLSDYRSCVEHHRQLIQKTVESLKNEERPFVTWGAGETAKKLLEGLRLADNPNWLGWIDVSPSKWGADFMGRRVMQPESLSELNPRLIVITASSAFEDEIKKTAVQYVDNLEFISISA